LLSGLLMARAGFGKGYVGIDPQRQGLVLAMDSVVKAPPLSAMGHHLQIEAARVEELSRKVARFGVAHLDVSQHVEVSPGVDDADTSKVTCVELRHTESL
jgi:hypothetical protein